MRKEEILSRIYFALRLKGVVSSKREFSIAIDFNYSCLSGAFSGNARYLTDNLFRRIEHTYPQLNREFIWYGTGEVFADSPMSPKLCDLLDSAVENGMEEREDGRLTAYTPPVGLNEPEEADEPSVITALMKELAEQREITKRAQESTEKALAQMDQLIEIIKNIASK